jgi:antitoxin component YwqK of YwqJK toxin-antitoxin module
MNSLKKLSLFAVLLTFVSCQNNEDSNVVSQRYVHKYGFDMSKDEWQTRKKEGKSITVLDNGVTITNNYNDNVLHGSTTYTFPNSSIIEKIFMFDNGILIKKIEHDSNGIPFKEEVYEPNDRKIITHWDKAGVPISIEQYENDFLIDGKYYKPDNDLEASIENGTGTRIKRDRDGELHYKDKISNGELVARITFHPNGYVKSKMFFHNYQLHGEQIDYSPTGEILMTMTWKSGNLHGIKTVYRNGKKITEIPFNEGMRHGVERHFDETGKLLVEIHWENDKKHGSHRVYKENDTEIKWYYKGKAVSLKRFEEFSYREKLIANKELFFEMIDQLDEETVLEE